VLVEKSSSSSSEYSAVGRSWWAGENVNADGGAVICCSNSLGSDSAIERVSCFGLTGEEDLEARRRASEGVVV
jgi:hypothetical protein